MNKKELFQGVLVGLLANIIGLVTAAIVLGKLSGNSDSILTVLETAHSENFIGKLISLGAFLNLISVANLLKGKLNNPENQNNRVGSKILTSILSVLPGVRNGGKINWRVFLYVTLCLYASFYFIPGVKKLLISAHFYEWPFINELHMLAVWKIKMGWFSFLEDPLKLKVVEWVKNFNAPFLLSATLVELVSIFILYKRKYAPLFLLAFGSLHIMIFLVSGILFWKWTLANFALVVLLIFLKDKSFDDVFDPKYFLFSIVIILFSTIYFSPPALGWWDTRNYFKFELEGVGESGESYRIQDSFLAPFHMIFIFQSYQYIIDEQVIIPAGQAHDQDQYLETRDAGVKGLQRVKEKYGDNPYDEERAEVLDEFLKTYFHNLNERKDKKTIFSFFASPRHVYFEELFSEPSGVYKMQEAIKLIKIRFVEYYYENDKVVLIQDKIIRNIPIP